MHEPHETTETIVDPEVRSPQKKPRRFVTLLLQSVFVTGLGLILVFAVFQRKLIYGPSHEMPSANRASATIHAPVLPVSVTANDGVVLQGWFVPASGTSSIEDLPHDEHPVVLWFCGNAGHRGYRSPDLAVIHSLDSHALIFDYRGYGQNEGKPSESALIDDANTIWKYATQDLGIAAERLVIFGESLGGGVAVQLAAAVCQQGASPGGLIVRATFSSLVDAGAYHYPWLPVRLLLVDRFSSSEHIQNVTCPICVMHGDRDGIVPIELGRRLFEAAPANSTTGEPKLFVELSGAGHNDILEKAEIAYRDAAGQFLKDVETRFAQSHRPPPAPAI